MKGLFIFILVIYNCCAAPYFTAPESRHTSFIGCLFADVCEPSESCHDDNLFGICKPAEISYTHQYQLDDDVIRVIQTQLSGLLDHGHTWNDLFTQCIMKTLLFEYRADTELDLSVCGSDPLTSVPTMLDQLGERLKREESIKLHKYFDTSRDNRGGSEEYQLTPEDMQLVDVLQNIERSPEYTISEEEVEVPSVTDFSDDNNQELIEEVNEAEQNIVRALNAALEEEIVRSKEEEEVKETNEIREAIKEMEDAVHEEENKEAYREMKHEMRLEVQQKEDAELLDALAKEPNPRSFTEENMGQVNQDTVDDKKKKKANPSNNHKEMANSKNAGVAKSTTQITQEDREDALGQLELTKRLTMMKRSGKEVQVIDKTWLWVRFKTRKLNDIEAESFVGQLSKKVGAHPRIFSFELDNDGQDLYFHVPRTSGVSPDMILQVMKNNSNVVPGFEIEDCGYGRKEHITKEAMSPTSDHFMLTAVICGAVLAVVVVMMVVFFLQKFKESKDKLYDITKIDPVVDESSSSYKDLCRQRMESRSSDRGGPFHPGMGPKMAGVSASARTSTSSWSEEPVQTNMDISTGHIILSYMEEHLNDKDKLEADWKVISNYEADNSETKEGDKSVNKGKNRYPNILPYDHSRVKLKKPLLDGSDYINASFVVDHDPKSPAYILTQGPLEDTASHFWAMVWEQGSSVIVCLTRLVEDGRQMSTKYWPEEGSCMYNDYEVNLVSEHVWCEDYLVRSFYLKNVDSGETRTVTQFHFFNWSDHGVPPSPKSILDFRRKVNKSFRGKQSPVIVHCSDGCGRSGTFTLLDMVLNRTAKGVKEIDIAAALEHLRDQRRDVVKTKEQFEFVLTAIAEEVHAMLKALPQ